jgi:hypothetical protein
MPTFLVELADPLPLSLGDELAKRVYYVAADIDSFSLVRRGEWVTGVEITTTDAADRAGLARKLEYVSRTEVLPQRLATAEPIWSSPHPAAGASGVFERLKELGAVHEMGPGAIATGPLFTDVLDALDARVRGVATERFGATEYRYPTLISTSTLVQGGYLKSFPQYVMSASRLCVDLDVYRQFVDGITGSEEPAALFDQHSGHSGYCLPPTMCFHTYLQLSGRRLPESRTVVTSRGKSFRFETRYSHSLERLWDFTIREIVFFGDADTVARCRQDFLDAACGLVDEWGLAGHVEPANDPFFADPTVPNRLLAQRMRRLKYELRLPAEDGRTISAASFNLHGTTFGEPYDITLPTGEPAYSACVGFGLERLAFAFFCQHGTNKQKWPDRLRDSLGV